MPLSAHQAQTELSPQQFDMVAQMGRGLVLGVSHGPRAGPQRPPPPPILGVPFYACSLCRRTTKFDVITYVGRSLFLGPATPHLKGWGPSAPQFWGFISIYAYTRCRRTSKFYAVAHMGRGLVFRGVSHAPTPAFPNLGGSPLSMSRLYKAEFKVYGEGFVFRRPDTPMHYHKCVARLVSNS